MDNLNIDLNLLKFENAFITDIQGKKEVKRCVCIPVAENDIFVSVDQQTGRAKAAYLHMTAWKSREEKYGQTHYITQSFSKEYREAHPNMERKPILGNGKPVETKEVSQQVQPQYQPPVGENVTLSESDDDLPF